DLHNWKPDKQTAQAESNIFGKDRRGKGGTNFELANIVLTVSDQRMAVVSEALRGILNLQIGEAMRVFFSEADHLTVLTVRGPDGAEGYEAAFIFKNGKFWRRQIRSNEGSSSTSWKLVQDMIYPNK
ncbi:MAG TPA: hypothetical protein VIT91_20940, partial [Chthoniobacterales bacterium]